LWGLQRLCADHPVLPEPLHRFAIRPMRTDDLAAVAALDAAAFGARRDALLGFLHGCRPACAWIAQCAEGDIAGFVLGRAGRTTLHLGPLIARDPDIAAALAARALAQEAASGATPVSIDVPDAQMAFRQRLTLAGFAPLRPFTRMLRGNDMAPARQELMFAIAGPELG
ncbi:MAG: hypothetical protein ACREJ0_24290, partial [Geminicoccaceae bacterium]